MSNPETTGAHDSSSSSAVVKPDAGVVADNLTEVVTETATTTAIAALESNGNAPQVSEVKADDAAAAETISEPKVAPVTATPTTATTEATATTENNDAADMDAAKVTKTATVASEANGKLSEVLAKADAAVETETVSAAGTATPTTAAAAMATAGNNDAADMDVTNERATANVASEANGKLSEILAKADAAAPSETVAAPATAATATTATTAKTENNDNDEDGDADIEDAVVEDDEEEKWFQNLEKAQEEEFSKAASSGQPKDLTAAPKLLQAALKEGQVPALSESEQESDFEHGKSAAKKDEEKKEQEVEAAAAVAASASADAPAAVPHYHQRVRVHGRNP
jgi:hypothetical protein